MKYPENDPDKIIDKLAATARSPRGMYSGAKSYPLLYKRLFTTSRRLSILRIGSAAAAVIMVCLIGAAIYNYASSVEMIRITTLAETKTIRLPDGTDVNLNRYTTLEYPKEFKGSKREIKLTGEAYFEVARDEQHPFIVEADEVNVQVLGTHFNVEAYSHDTQIKTTLLEGSVAVSNRNTDRRIVLKPNQNAVYDKSSRQLLMNETEDALNEIAWKDGMLIFSQIPLQEIARQLSNTYNVKISIHDSALSAYRMTGRFSSSETIEKILDALSIAGNFEYKINEQTIDITTKNY